MILFNIDKQSALRFFSVILFLIIIPKPINFRCRQDTLNKAKDDKMLHDKLQLRLQFSDEMQELLRREVQLLLSEYFITTVDVTLF